MNIIEKENLIIKKILEFYKQKKNVYIFGAGSGANILYEGFNKADVFDYIDGFVVDDKYYNEDSLLGKPIIPLSRVLNEDSLLINSIRNFQFKNIRQISNSLCLLDEDIMSLWSLDNKLLDYDFFNENKESFKFLYDILSDEKSKSTLEAWINSKISGKYSYLFDLWSDDQYFVEDIVSFDKINLFVDCGAYDGDSFIAFRNAYQHNLNKSFSGKAFLYEPDNDNYQKMIQNTKQFRDVYCENIGISNCYQILTFKDGETTSSSLSEDGTIKIVVNSLDNLIREKIDFVKMDIEGCEEDALLGMKNHIIKDAPQLAICVYHKRSDLLIIPRLISSICSDYKFYIRAHKPWSQELVLYAIHP